MQITVHVDIRTLKHQNIVQEYKYYDQTLKECSLLIQFINSFIYSMFFFFTCLHTDFNWMGS